MSQTVSMSVGRVAILHDIRKEISDNVDQTLITRNEIFIDKLKKYNYDLKAFTNDKFQKFIDEYNSKQSRPERRKTRSYVEMIEEENKKLINKAEDNKKKGIKSSVRKPTQLAHEYVLQIGNKDTNSTLTADVEKNKQYCREVLEEIEKKYPHVEVLLATYHADEPQGTPHMHILVQFTGEGYKQGLNKQISISKALEQDGFERSNNRGDYAINRWVEDVKDNIMTPKLERIYGEEREILNDKRSHEDIRFFRKKAKEEAEALSKIKIEVEKKVENRTCDLKEIDEQIKYQEKRLNFYTRRQEEAKKEYNLQMDKLDSVANEVCMLEMRQLDLDRNINDKTNHIKVLQGEINDIKEKKDKYKQQKDTAEKELNDVLEQIAFYKGDKSIALMSDFTLLMADDKHMQLPAIQKQIEELQRKYDQLKKQPPQIKTIEKVVEVKKEVKVPVEVPVEVKKEVLVYKEINVDYKSLHHKLANIMWRIYDKLLQHDDLHAAFNSAKIKDDVEYNDIAIAATESDDIIRGIDQQIKRNAKSR